MSELVSPIFCHKIWTSAWILRMILKGVISFFFHIFVVRKRRISLEYWYISLYSKYVMWSQNFVNYRTLLCVHIFNFHCINTFAM